MSRVANAATVARREYLVRARSRAFVIGTVLMVVSVVAIVFAPALLARIGNEPASIGVTSPDPALRQSVIASLGPLLDAATTTSGATGAGAGTTPGATASAAPGTAPTPSGEGSATQGGLPGSAGFSVTGYDDLAAARQAVTGGTLAAALDVTRDSSGQLAFTLYTTSTSNGRTATTVRQALTAVAIADRLERLGIAPADRATLFAPAAVQVAAADPSVPGGRLKDEEALMGQGALGFAATILIFMMVIVYGTWIAQSVVEEKSSRVMEVVLNAATPFELLAGKVIGVGAVALTQYAALLAGGLVALAVQAPVSDVLAGPGAAGSALPSGLTPSLLAALVAYGVLGFLLYATLFAAAGSLVSRSEDVNSAVMPLTLLCTVGYMAGTWGATGLLDLGSGGLVALTLVPFLSPFMMVGRIAAGLVEPWQVAVSLGLLALGVVVALWVAARIYALGVLLYGSWPGWRGVWRLLRQGM